MEISTQERPLGKSGITVPALGVGTNRWGGGAADQSQLDATYTAALDAGMGFLDTAEVYSGGKSERSIGTAALRDLRPAIVASKFAPFPHRLTPAQLASALHKTLDRLGLESIDLYYLHFPFSPLGVGTWMKPMAKAVQAGKIRAVGVSNCSVAQMRKAAAVLGRYDIPLAANQVHYSLFNRKPETNGVLDACREMDIALVAYRPIGGGAVASGSRKGADGLSEVLHEVAGSHDATTTQVALAWLLQRDPRVIPIPGATKPQHVRENAGAMSLRLSEEEFAAIDRASSRGRGSQTV